MYYFFFKWLNKEDKQLLHTKDFNCLGFEIV